jgi:hypothetical protein
LRATDQFSLLFSGFRRRLRNARTAMARRTSQMMATTTAMMTMRRVMDGL